jgi:hypothetical protein
MHLSRPSCTQKYNLLFLHQNIKLLVPSSSIGGVFISYVTEANICVVYLGLGLGLPIIVKDYYTFQTLHERRHHYLQNLFAGSVTCHYPETRNWLLGESGRR